MRTAREYFIPSIPSRGVRLFFMLFLLLFALGGCGQEPITKPPVSTTIKGCEACSDKCLKAKDGKTGKCVACLTDKQCRKDDSATQKCVENTCVCGTDKDCEENQHCTSDPKKGKEGCLGCKPQETRECETSEGKSCKKGQQTCSDKGEWGACTGEVVCKDDEKCEAGACVPDCPEPPPCTEEGKTCISKASEQPGTYKTCQKNSKGCFELSEVQKCKATEVCAKGACIPYTCPAPECQAGKSQCTGDSSYKECSKDKNGCLIWSTPKNCTDGKKCKTDTGTCLLCKPGEKTSCYTGAKGTEGKGICKPGVQVCSSDGGKWGVCTGEVISKAEECNDKDDDCDGQIDNGLVAPACKNQTGSCKGAVKRCGGPKGWLPCEAADYQKAFKEYEAKESKCDGKDNNCDGKIDNGLTAPACSKKVGVCKGLSQKCGGAKGWIPCSEQDYKTHNAEYEAKESKCDGKDNNCDGKIDDALARACTGKCGSGTEKCVAGKWQFCSAPGAKPEICDGKDNDCSGKIDDNLTAPACSKQLGVCKGSVKRCGGAKGWLPCETADYIKKDSSYQTRELECDKKDNDCDGKVDEELSSIAERPCDKKDNDCDGKIDEVSCSKGTQCSGTRCVVCQRPARTTCKYFLGTCTSSAPCPKCPCGLSCYRYKKTIRGYYEFASCR